MGKPHIVVKRDRGGNPCPFGTKHAQKGLSEEQTPLMVCFEVVEPQVDSRRDLAQAREESRDDQDFHAFR